MIKENQVSEPARSFRFEVKPVDDHVSRPLWSVMIPAYNCGRFIKESLLSVLDQDPGPGLMQIEVIDDCSTDSDLVDLVTSLSNGRVEYFRQSVNVGHIRNFETCLNHSKGKLIHILHCDDYVKSGFYHKLQKAFESDAGIGAAFTRHFFLDENGEQNSISPLEQEEPGRLYNHLERLALEQRIMTPSIVVRREIYEKLGGFDSRLICAEDWEMWVRIAANYPVWYEPEPLAAYRMHNKSNTGRHIRSGEDISYTRLAINIFKSYLPAESAEYIAHKALNTYSKSAIDNAIYMFWKKDSAAMRSQLKEAFKCSKDVSVYSHLLYKITKSLKTKLSGVSE